MKGFFIIIEACLVCAAVFSLLDVTFENLGFCDFKDEVFTVSVCTAITYQFNNLRKELL